MVTRMVVFSVQGELGFVLVIVWLILPRVDFTHAIFCSVQALESNSGGSLVNFS